MALFSLVEANITDRGHFRCVPYPKYMFLRKLILAPLLL